MKKLAPTLLAAALVSSTAWAQLPPIIASSQPYQPLTAGTVVSALNGDDQGVLVPLGFSFPYFGQSYTHVMLNSNGVLVLGTAATTVCATGCNGNATFPSTATPNPALAAFWDDLDLRVSGSVRTLTSPGQFAVEYVAVPRFVTPTSSVTFQIKLNASGTITFHYGSIVGAATTFSASAGFENPTGTLGANLLAGCTTSCAVANFPPNAVFTIGEPNEADLAVSTVTIANFTTQMDGNLNFTVNSTLRNFGRTAANNFMWRAYISRDQELDLTATDGGADQQVAEGGPHSLEAVDGGFLPDGGLSVIAVTASAATTTPPATGEYFVLVRVDATDTVMEASEANNLGSTTTAFVQGIDLVATSISGPLTTGGGNPENFAISFFNRGTTPAGNVGFRILLSADTVLDASDFPLFTGTRMVSGGETITQTVPVTIPANAPSGQFHFLLQIDPAGTVLEANETNNVVASAAKVDVRRADLVNEQVQFVDPVTGLSTSSARFGDPVVLKVRFRNTGGANANNFRVALVLSTDSSLSLLSDTYVCDQVVPQTVPSTVSTEVTLNCTLPARNTASVPFRTGPYFVFGVVDSSGAVFETNKANNSLMLGPIRITEPGADLAVTSITAPASAGVGEIVPVVRTLRNIGNLDAPQVTYRFFASANDIITSDDVPLRIVDNAGMPRDFGSITLGRGGSDTATELVQLPGTMAAGTYYVGCLIDLEGTAQTELDVTNNALASRSMVVAPSSLRVVNTSLPDAVVGRPYTFRLSAVGEQGPSTWRIDPLLGPAPAWLNIGVNDGLLTGTPSGANGSEVVGVTVIVANAGRQSAVRLALRVLPTTSSLEITSTSLPAVVNSSASQYLFSLGAAGGVRPYSWRLAGGTLPTGMSLSPEGVLSGAPRNATNGSLALNLEVRDAVGGRATRALALRLIAPGAITFRTLFITDALVGQEYLQDIAVANQDGSMLAKPLTWRVTGAVPNGIAVTPQAELITVAGRPTQAGNFSFTISVEDNNGRTDSLAFTLTVYPPRYRVVTALPEVLRPGEVVSVSLNVSPSGEVKYQVVNGLLPPGLALDERGLISGTVAEEGAEGTWSFVAEVRDASGMSGLTPLALRVERLPRAVGCSAAGTAAPAWMLLMVLMLRRRNLSLRRGERSVRRTG
ncbi:MAG: CARDB domain-containing protein [Archangium sp.]|nr:CARDB domain-containing protein [Archangium sp.]